MASFSVAITLLLFTSAYGSSIGAGYITVTPPATTGPNLNQCHDRSKVKTGSFHDVCTRYRRQSCVKGSVDLDVNQVYFRAAYPSFLVPDSDGFGQIDTYLESQFSFMFAKLDKIGTEEAKRCKALGSYFVCGSFYPFCRKFTIGQISEVLNLAPCQSVCRAVKSACQEPLSTNEPLLWSQLSEYILDCDDATKFPTKCAELEEKCVYDDEWCADRGDAKECQGRDKELKEGSATQPDETEETEECASRGDAKKCQGDDEKEGSATQPSETETENVEENKSDDDQCEPVADDAEKCEECLKVRNSYSQRTMFPSKPHKFWAEVEVLRKYGTVWNGNCSQAYDVTILRNYDIDCSFSEKYSCGKNVTVYSTDIGCKCVNDHIKVGQKYTIACGEATHDEWVLNAANKQCIISQDKPKDQDKLSRWFKKNKCTDAKKRQPCSADDKKDTGRAGR